MTNRFRVHATEGRRGHALTFSGPNPYQGFYYSGAALDLLRKIKQHVLLSSSIHQLNYIIVSFQKCKIKLN